MESRRDEGVGVEDTSSERATGNAVYIGVEQEEGEDIEADEDITEAELTISGE